MADTLRSSTYGSHRTNERGSLAFFLGAVLVETMMADFLFFQSRSCACCLSVSPHYTDYMTQSPSTRLSPSPSSSHSYGESLYFCRDVVVITLMYY